MSVPKRKRVEEARDLLERAKEQLGRAQVAWWEPAEPADCVTNAFYAYENALTAAVVAVGMKPTKQHYEKSVLAKRLFQENRLKTDVSDLLKTLNEVRKDVQYGESGDQLRQVDLEELVTELETFVGEVEALLDEVEESYR